MKRIVFAILLLGSIAGCKVNNENQKKILGHWAGASWLVEGKTAGHNVEETFFHFEENGDYVFEYGGTKEKGTFKVENDMLFTKPAGQSEIMVKIAKLSGDSLVFDMNRSGLAEQLTLVRKK